MLWWASCMPPGLRHLHAAAASTCAAAWIACGLPRHSAHRACKCCGVVFGVIAAAAAAASTDGTAPPVVHAWQGPYASSPSVACTQLKNGSSPTCFFWVAGVCHTGCMLCCTPAALVALVRSCSAGRARGRRACAPSPRAVCIPWVSSSGCSWPGSRAGKHEHQQFQSPPEHITTAWQAGQALLWPFGRAGCAATGGPASGASRVRARRAPPAVTWTRLPRRFGDFSAYPPAQFHSKPPACVWGCFHGAQLPLCWPCLPAPASLPPRGAWSSPMAQTVILQVSAAGRRPCAGRFARAGPGTTPLCPLNPRRHGHRGRGGPAGRWAREVRPAEG